MTDAAWLTGQQLETIEPVGAEVLAQVRFICDPSDINTQILGNESAHFSVSNTFVTVRFVELSSSY
jgi:hypothetical protein